MSHVLVTIVVRNAIWNAGFKFERVLFPIGVHCPLRWYQLKMMQRSRLAVSVFRLLQFFFCRLGLEEKLPVQFSGDICR